MKRKVWEPLEDGYHDCPAIYNQIEIDDKSLSVRSWDDRGYYWAKTDLPDDIRLCRLVDAEDAMPEGVRAALDRMLQYVSDQLDEGYAPDDVADAEFAWRTWEDKQGKGGNDGD